MRILFLTQVLPYPLDAGPKVRAYYVLRYLAQTHDITLVSFIRPTDTRQAIEHLREFCQAVHTVPMPRSRLLDLTHLLQSLVGSSPFLITRDWVKAMAQLLENIVRHNGSFDAVHADQLWMAPYALLAQEFAPQRSPLSVLDQHNAVYMIPKRLAADVNNPLKRIALELEWRKLAHYEIATCQRFHHVVWVTPEDYDTLQYRNGAGTVTLPNSGIIPICVDPANTLPMPGKKPARRVTFLGGLHYPPNAAGICWFAEQVFARILAEVPDAILTVIGKQPPTLLHKLGIPPANLEVTDYVDDPTPYLAESAVFIVPLHAGGGMRVKILDAWKWGIPMVSTTIGAEGIEIQPGENIYIADTPKDFAARTVDLLQNPEVARNMGQAGQQWLRNKYNWQTTYRLWDHIYH